MVCNLKKELSEALKINMDETESLADIFMHIKQHHMKKKLQESTQYSEE